jgi:Taurine catabolism dioxygenase TauD, TfdA family
MGGLSPMERSPWPSSPVGPQATCWSRRDLINRSYAWFRSFPKLLRSELMEAAEALAARAHPLGAWAGLEMWSGLNGFGQAFRHELESRSGVVYLTGLAPPGKVISDEVLRWTYLLIGLQAGAPIGPHGSLVEMSGRCQPGISQASPEASPETSFHTDSGGPEVPDVVGMLCLAPARTGGECQVASATLAHELLKADCRDLLGELYAPFPRYDSDGEGGPAHPIFASDGHTLLFNYMRQRIEAGHARARIPLTPRQLAGLDRLDRALGDPQASVQFKMKRGEMLFVNNRHIAHNRQSFVDHADPARRRRMLRMWLSFPGNRA